MNQIVDGSIYVAVVQQNDRLEVRLRTQTDFVGSFLAHQAGHPIRIRVFNSDGTSSAVWRIFGNKNSGDIIIGSRSFLRFQKLTLHPSGKWRYAWTDESAPRFVEEDEDRVFQRWEAPAEFGSGWMHAVQIWIHEDDVTSAAVPASKNQKLTSIPNGPTGTATGLSVMLIKPDQGEVLLTDFKLQDMFSIQRRHTAPELCLVLSSQRRLSEEVIWAHASARAKTLEALLKTAPYSSVANPRVLCHSEDEEGRPVL